MLKVKPRQQQKIPATLLPGFNDKVESNKSTFIHSFIHAFKQGKEGKSLNKRKNYKVGSIIKILISATIIGFILFFAIFNFEGTNDGSTSTRQLSLFGGFFSKSKTSAKQGFSKKQFDAVNTELQKTQNALLEAIRSMEKIPRQYCQTDFLKILAENISVDFLRILANGLEPNKFYGSDDFGIWNVINKSSEHFIYIGRILRDGKFDGKGTTFNLTNGLRQVGTFEDGEPHGDFVTHERYDGRLKRTEGHYVRGCRESTKSVTYVDEYDE